MAGNKYGKATKRATAKRDNGSASTARKAAGAVAGVAAARAAAKTAKRLGGKTVAIVVISLVIAIIAGACACFYLSRKDAFELVGWQYVTLEVGEGYADEGVRIIEFGRDVSDKAEIKTDMVLVDGKYYASGEETEYYMIYTVNTLKFGKIYPVQKIRIVTFVQPTEEDALKAVSEG